MPDTAVDLTESSKRPEGLRFKWASLFETVLALGLIMAVNAMFQPHLFGYLKIHPHPFWIVVIFIAIRYPFKEALISSLIVAATYCSLVVINHPGTFYFSSLRMFSDFREGILFLIVGGIISEATGRHLGHIFNLDEKLSMRETQIKQLKDRHLASEEALKKLEGRISAQFVSEMDLLNALTATRQKSLVQMKIHLVETVLKYLRAQDCTFYKVAGESLVKTEFRDDDEIDVSAASEDDLLLFEALRSKAPAYLGHVVHQADFDRFSGNTILAGPILDRYGDVVAVIGVEKMPFVDYNPSAFKLFDTILRWWGTELEEKQRLEDLRTKGVINESLGIYTNSYFFRRFTEEFNRAKQFSIPLSLGIIQIRDYAKIEERSRSDVTALVAKIMAQNVSDLDMVANYNSDNAFIVAFPVVPAKKAQERVDKIISEIDEFEFSPYPESGARLSFDFIVKDFQIGMKTAAEFVKTVDRALRQNAGN